VSVEGVDFEPYLQLLLAGEHPRVDRVVVVTDRDHTGAGDVRKTTYETTFAEAHADGRLHVTVGGTTLEAELFRETTSAMSRGSLRRPQRPQGGADRAADVPQRQDRADGPARHRR
jgi:hypothetical protein